MLREVAPLHYKELIIADQVAVTTELSVCSQTQKWRVKPYAYHLSFCFFAFWFDWVVQWFRRSENLSLMQHVFNARAWTRKDSDKKYYEH